MRNADRPLTKALIIEHVWDIHFDSISNVVEVHINSLRNKIDGTRPFRSSTPSVESGTCSPTNRREAMDAPNHIDAFVRRGPGAVSRRLGFGVLHVFARQLDADATAELREMTRAVHGYLRFEGGTPVLTYRPGGSRPGDVRTGSRAGPCPVYDATWRPARPISGARASRAALHVSRGARVRRTSRCLRRANGPANGFGSRTAWSRPRSASATWSR